MKKILVFFLLLSFSAFAVTPEPSLPDAAQEARAQKLGYEIRCVVCQSESINDSQADMARDLRLLVRDKIREGLSDDAVRDFLRVRYGDFILLKPPFQLNTYALWLFPLAAFIAAAGVAFGYYKKHSKNKN